MPENAEAWELLQASASQVRLSPLGGPLGFDYKAVALMADAFGIELTPGLWRKVRAVEAVLRADAAKRDAETSR